MSIVNKIINNGIGTIFLKISPLLLNVYIARNYNNETYAEYITLISTVVLFGTTYLNTISQYISSYIEKPSHIYTAYVHIFIYLAIVMVFLYCNGGNFISSIITIIIIALITPKIGILYKNKEHKKYSTICIFAFLLLTSLISIVIIYKIKLENNQLVYLYLSPYLVIFITQFNKNLKLSIMREKINKFQLTQMTILTMSAMIVPFAYWLIYNKMSDLIKSSDIALFASILQWTFIFSQLSMVISNVLISYLKDTKISENINIYFSWTIASVLVSILIIFEEIHPLIFGANYEVKNIIIPFILVQTVIIINSLKSYIYRLIIISEKNYLTFISNMLWALSLLFQIYFSETITIKNLCEYYFYSTLFSLCILCPLYYKNFSSELKSLINYKSYSLLLYYILSVTISITIYSKIFSIILLITTTTLLFYILRKKT